MRCQNFDICWNHAATRPYVAALWLQRWNSVNLFYGQANDFITKKTKYNLHTYPQESFSGTKVTHKCCYCAATTSERLRLKRKNVVNVTDRIIFFNIKLFAWTPWFLRNKLTRLQGFVLRWNYVATCTHVASVWLQRRNLVNPVYGLAIRISIAETLRNP